MLSFLEFIQQRKKVLIFDYFLKQQTSPNFFDLLSCYLRFLIFIFNLKERIQMKGSKVAQSTKGAPPKAKSNWKDRISSNDYEELKATFDLFDADGGGTIDPEEIQKVLKELGLIGRSKIVFEMISGLRALSRPIRFEEFLEIVASKAGDTNSREGLAKVFELWDVEGTGTIDFQAFKRIARELGETLNDDELTEMMHNAYILNSNQTHDAFSFDEFYNVVTKKTP